MAASGELTEDELSFPEKEERIAHWLGISDFDLLWVAPHDKPPTPDSPTPLVQNEQVLREEFQQAAESEPGFKSEDDVYAPALKFLVIAPTCRGHELLAFEHTLAGDGNQKGDGAFVSSQDRTILYGFLEVKSPSSETGTVPTENKAEHKPEGGTSAAIRHHIAQCFHQFLLQVHAPQKYTLHDPVRPPSPRLLNPPHSIQFYIVLCRVETLLVYRIGLIETFIDEIRVASAFLEEGDNERKHRQLLVAFKDIAHCPRLLALVPPAHLLTSDEQRRGPSRLLRPEGLQREGRSPRAVRGCSGP